MLVNFSFMKVTMERLEQVMAGLKVSKADFMTGMNLSKQNYQHWKERGIPGNKLIPVCTFLGISLDELTGKKTKKSSSDPAFTSDKEDRIDIHELVDSLPPKLLNRARAALQFFVVEDPVSIPGRVRKKA